MHIRSMLAGLMVFILANLFFTSVVYYISGDPQMQMMLGMPAFLFSMFGGMLLMHGFIREPVRNDKVR